jgi:ABC-2 type transport system ATP-binding protein
MINQNVIEVKDVFKSFKDVHAVNGININIREGQFIALLGPNGAGKTTLVEMIEGIQKPDNGEILIMGKHWHGNEDELHQYIGLSLQETRFIDKINVVETMQLFASFYPGSKADNKKIVHILNMIGLEEKKNSYTVNLSGGQRQKLALGIALLNNPKILLLDEPTTGLDPNARREIWNILLKLKKETHTSLILTTHYMEEAEQLCEYIIFIDKGRILTEGNIEELLNNNDKKIIEFTLENRITGKDFADSPFELKWDDNSESGSIILSSPENELQNFFAYLKNKNLQLKNFESRRKTLDDMFTSLTGRHLDEENS